MNLSNTPAAHPLSVLDLAARLQDAVNAGYGDHAAVVVYKSSRVMRPSPSVGITGVSAGSPGEHGRVILNTQKTLGPATESLDRTRQRMERLSALQFHAQQILANPKLSDAVCVAQLRALLGSHPPK